MSIATDYIARYGATGAATCRTCEETRTDDGLALADGGTAHVHCAVCAGAIMDDMSACAWCGTFAPWTTDPHVIPDGLGAFMVDHHTFDGPAPVFTTRALAERAARSYVLGPYDDDSAAAAESAVRAGRETRFSARETAEPMRGTFAAWLGGREAVSGSYVRETAEPSPVPFGQRVRRNVAPSLGDPRPFNDPARIAEPMTRETRPDFYRRMFTAPSGRPFAECGPAHLPHVWAIIAGRERVAA